MNVLTEFQSETGGVLWMSLRTVLLWGETSPGDRSDLFPEGAHERRHAEILTVVDDRDLEAPLKEIAQILRKPEKARPEAIGLACARVARWAQRQGKPLTALEFLQAAAVACPIDPRHALEVGRATRDRAQYARAEAWLQRAVGLGRQAKDWDTYIRAYISLGKMMMRRGAYPAARRSLTKALRRAIRQGHRETEAMALHDLFILEAQTDNWDEAQGFAVRALRAYGKGHRLLPALAHDVAYAWVQRGDHEHALPVFHAVYPTVGESHRPGVLGSIARSAGALQDGEGYGWARDQLLEIRDAPGVAEAWTDVARGAAALSRWDEADEAARHAERLAIRRKESRVTFTAEGIIEEIQAERKADQALREKRSPEVATDRRTDELAGNLVRLLQGSQPGD